MFRGSRCGGIEKLCKVATGIRAVERKTTTVAMSVAPVVAAQTPRGPAFQSLSLEVRRLEFVGAGMRSKITYETPRAR